MSHYEIVQNSDGHTARIVSNGNTLMSSGGQVYARRVGAERAVISVARAHGVPVDHLVWNVPDVEKVMVNRFGAAIEGAPLVKYLDERTGSDDDD